MDRRTFWITVREVVGFVGLIIIVALLVVLSSWVEGSEPTAVIVPASVSRQTDREVRNFLRILGERDRLFEVRVQSAPLFDGDSRIVAWTGRADFGSPTDRCVLTFNETSIGRRSSIAHEVCHCVQDWEVMGPTSYLPGVMPIEVQAREAGALLCERTLTEEGFDALMMRRQMAADRRSR